MGSEDSPEAGGPWCGTSHSPPSFPAAAASPRRRKAGCWTAVRGTGLPPSPPLPSRPAEEQEHDFLTEKTACREESSTVYLAAGPLTYEPSSLRFVHFNEYGRKRTETIRNITKKKTIFTRDGGGGGRWLGGKQKHYSVLVQLSPASQ